MTLRVLEPGLCTLVVDFGRPATRSLGVPVGGAADRLSLALGNALVGNAPEAAALEICLAGPTLVANCESACVVYGAPFELVAPRQHLTAGKTFTLRAGEELRIGGTSEGVRAYLCVRGGLETPFILGSRSSLGPVTAGAELPCQPSTIQARFFHPPEDQPSDQRELRVLDGPQGSWFIGEAFYRQEWTVTQESDRMGLRLAGEPLAVPGRELVSEPVCPGAVQVTSNGQCIVLGVDGQTIGGYPKIAQVISADLDRLGRHPPGERLRFRRIGVEEAAVLYRRRQKELNAWVTRLRAAEIFAQAKGEDSGIWQ
jgi:antagonist of KipI